MYDTHTTIGINIKHTTLYLESTRLSMFKNTLTPSDHSHFTFLTLVQPYIIHKGLISKQLTSSTKGLVSTLIPLSS